MEDQILKAAPASALPEDPPLRWHWRNCRSLGFSLHLWLWPWTIGAYRDDDVYGGARYLSLGPLCLGIHYSIGNCSSYGLDRFTGLSECEAAERAERWEGRL